MTLTIAPALYMCKENWCVHEDPYGQYILGDVNPMLQRVGMLRNGRKRMLSH